MAHRDPLDQPAQGSWLTAINSVQAIMLQEFMPGRQQKDALGAGISVSFMCADALALYREFKSRGILPRNRPSVGSLVVPLTDPDGYRTEFSSPTDAPEESELED